MNLDLKNILNTSTFPPELSDLKHENLLEVLPQIVCDFNSQRVVLSLPDEEDDLQPILRASLLKNCFLKRGISINLRIGNVVNPILVFILNRLIRLESSEDVQANKFLKQYLGRNS